MRLTTIPGRGPRRCRLLAVGAEGRDVELSVRAGLFVEIGLAPGVDDAAGDGRLTVPGAGDGSTTAFTA